MLTSLSSLEDRQRFSVVTPQDVVDVTDAVVGAVGGRHAFDLNSLSSSRFKPASASSLSMMNARLCLVQDRHCSGGGFASATCRRRSAVHLASARRLVPVPSLLLLGQLRF